jgi:MSHA biogenesis protein MshO
MNARARGFTLVEMVVAIVVAGIVVGFMAMFMLAPVNSYVAQQRRTDLVDSANNAMRMIQSDIRTALPDSVRAITVGANRTVEMLYADGARYRAGIATPNTDLEKSGDTRFDAIGCFLNTPPGVYSTAAFPFLVVGHDVGGGNAYNPVANIRTTAGTQITIAGANTPCLADQAIQLDQNFSFPADSPALRVYLVKEAVAYVCNLTTGTLKRFWGYSTAVGQASRATEAQLLAAGAASSLVARDVTDCTFTPRAERAGSIYGGILIVRMTFARNGESFQAFDQAQVENLK